MTATTPGSPGAQPLAPRDAGARRLAAVVCLLEALVLTGFGLFYLVELARGEATDVARVVTESALIVLTAAGLAVLGRLWLGRSGWPGTPTVVWHVLLIPVTVAMIQSGQLVVATLLALAIITAIGAAVGAAVRRGEG